MGVADSDREAALVIKYFILWSIYLVVAVIAFNIVLAVVLEGYEMAKERRDSQQHAFFIADWYATTRGRSPKVKFLKSAAATALWEWFMLGNSIEPANPEFVFADNKLERHGHGAVSEEELLDEVARFFADSAIGGRASDLTLFYGKERIENSSPPE